MRTLGLVLALALLSPAARAATERAYIGSFTNATNAPLSNPFSSGHGEGIYVADFDTVTGRLTVPRLVARTPQPTWIAIDQARGVLYAGNYYHGFTDPKVDHGVGAIAAYRIDRASGDLTLINQVSAGDAPAYLVIDPSGKYIVSANYDDGSISVLPIRADGGVGDYTDIVRPQGPRAPDRAADNPPGNIAPSKHDHSHIHSAGFDPSGKYLVVDDAGLDTVRLFTLDGATGKLNPVSTFAATPGAAPRHFAFRGRVFYNLMEQDSKVTVSDFDPATGALTLRQTLSALPADFAGSNLASELVIAPDGRHLYTANRLRDTITSFAVAADGSLTRLGEVPTGNSFPRSIALDPGGRYLFSMNQYGDSITTFRLDAKTGLPRPEGPPVPVGNPAVMVFLN